MNQSIRLRSISGPMQGQSWQSNTLLRIGRLATLEIMLEDSTVSEVHAIVRINDQGEWVVDDLESTNGTYVNGIQVSPDQVQVIKPLDIVQFGKVVFMVEMDTHATDYHEDMPTFDPFTQLAAPLSVPTPAGGSMPQSSRTSRHAEPHYQMLLRATHHLAHVKHEDQFLDAILNDAVTVLDARRGAIIVANGEGPDPELKLRTLAVGPGEGPHRFSSDLKLARRVFTTGEALLLTNLHEMDEDSSTPCSAEGAMASVLCVVMRTPRRKIGVLHLDRGFFQPAFSESDLHLADALAAFLALAIENHRLHLSSQQTG